MFGWKKKADGNGASIGGWLLRPDFGSDVRPMFEVHHEFVRTLALCFASYKMFPAEHPALRDPKAVLSVAEVLKAAWRAIPSGHQGIAKGCVFACVILSLLAGIALLASLAAGIVGASGIRL